MKSRSEWRERIDKLVPKACRLFHGEDMITVTSVCTLVMAISIARTFPKGEGRDAALSTTIAWLRHHVDRLDKGERLK